MIQSLTPNQSLTMRGSFEPSIQGVCCDLSVPHSSLKKKNEGQPFTPLLSRAGLVPHGQLRKKFEGQPSVPLLSKSPGNWSVPNTTLILNIIYLSNISSKYIILKISAGKKFGAVNFSSRRNHQQETAEQILVSRFETKDKFFCRWNSKECLRQRESNHQSNANLSQAARKFFPGSNYQQDTAASISVSKDTAKFFSHQEIPVTGHTSSLSRSGSVTRIPSVSSNSVAVALWHLSRLTDLYQSREALRAFSLTKQGNFYEAV